MLQYLRTPSMFTLQLGTKLALTALVRTVLSCCRLLVFLRIMALVDYDLKAAGASYSDKYDKLGDDGWVWTPRDAKFLSAVAQAQYQTGEEKDEHIAVPLWVLAGLVDGVYEPSELGLYASTCTIKAHVIGATLKDAEEQGFYDRVGTRTEWQSIEAHAHDFALFAAEQRPAGNAEPYIAEEDDFHSIIVPAIAAGHEFVVLNELVVTDMARTITIRLRGGGSPNQVGSCALEWHSNLCFTIMHLHCWNSGSWHVARCSITSSRFCQV